MLLAWQWMLSHLLLTPLMNHHQPWWVCSSSSNSSSSSSQTSPLWVLQPLWDQQQQQLSVRTYHSSSRSTWGLVTATSSCLAVYTGSSSNS
jgi:hypothetical protein